MLANIGLPYTTENLSDTMFYIRYAHDNLTPANGGPPLKLKDYSAQFIDRNAKYHEHILDTEKTSIAKELNLKLKLRLKDCIPPERLHARTYTLKVLEDIFKDPIADYTDLPADAQEKYLEWLNNDVPAQMRTHVQSIIKSSMIPYNLLNRENVIKYAHFDVIYTLEIWIKLNPVVIARHNERGIEIENSLIMPLFEMERTGFCADKEYLEECRRAVKAYTIERRTRFYELAGEIVDVRQHPRIKAILQERFGLTVESTDKNALVLIKADLIHNGGNPDAIEFISILQELRTLEKWYSTYIIRFLNDLKYSNRLYTTINQVGTVSGRVTSDFQQFPKNPIRKMDAEKEEDRTILFHPRHIIKVEGGHKIAICLADFSQIELRVQALYTILVGHADLNLCRAYMPYQRHNAAGKEFDCHDINDIRNWDKEWFYDEKPGVLWSPTDVHGATTEMATGLKPDDPQFHKLRSVIGKRVNFAKNYGAQLARIKVMFPEKSDEEQRRINDAYYKAFPGVKFYHDYCYQRAEASCWTANLFGIRYYNVSGHKLINLLIQGSSAYYLKIKEREIYDYCKANHLYSRWQMQIHDELMWEYDDRDDPAVIFEFKRIMENWPETLVPLVAEADVTTTTWDAKEGVANLDELRLRLSA
jgi:DNA polymerase-1